MGDGAGCRYMVQVFPSIVHIPALSRDQYSEAVSLYKAGYPDIWRSKSLGATGELH